MLCVHGYGSSIDMWQAHDDRKDGAGLGEVHDVVALNLTGHDDSEDAELKPRPKTLDAYAVKVVAVADVADATAFVGHS